MKAFLAGVLISMALALLVVLLLMLASFNSTFIYRGF